MLHSLDWGTGDYTVEGWIFPHGTGNCDVIDLRSSSMNQGVALTLKSGNKIWAYLLWWFTIYYW